MTNRPTWMEWIVDTLREAAWAPLSVFGFYLAGLALRLYKSFPLLDIPTHFMGGVVITYFYRAAIRNSQKWVGDIPLPIQALLAVTGAGTTAILWEFDENILDFFLATRMVRGVQDTIVDLFTGLLGALVFSLFYRPRSSS